ncbi:DNA repair ATPase-like protein [Rhynchospora pubera]|uniref:DNA repair ATPase-like protein n=1 Tax=Rhynchospora pubera TaxID=906938 RepID=A0AAV8GM49_9POAL|nr:DNA repair ATPase-like protein [Rhynchospora pubera]
MTLYMEEMCVEWNEYGVPLMASFLQMAQKWAEPHLETAKTIWLLLKTYTEPYIHLAWSKSVEWYKTAEIITAPHITKFQEVTYPHIQKVMKILDLYFDRSAELIEAYVEKLIVLMLLYTERVMETYTIFLKSATTYCHQSQANIGEYLNMHELTKKLATKEASALLGLTFLLYCISSQLFCVKKPRKQTRSSCRNHRFCQHKRRHANK